MKTFQEFLLEGSAGEEAAGFKGAEKGRARGGSGYRGPTFKDPKSPKVPMPSWKRLKLKRGKDTSYKKTPERKPSPHSSKKETKALPAGKERKALPASKETKQISGAPERKKIAPSPQKKSIAGGSSSIVKRTSSELARSQ